MGARIYLLSFSLDFVAVELDTTISHQKSLSKAHKTTKNHHFLSLCLRYRWGWQKLKRSFYFQCQAVVSSSIHQLKKLNRLKTKNTAKNLKIPTKSHFPNLNPKIPISPQLSTNPTKINTFTYLTPKFQTHNPNYFLPI